MFALETYEACDPNQAMSCRVVWRLTENETAAQTSEWLIGMPTAVLFIVIVALLVRWSLARVIDRVIRKAEGGVLPGRGATANHTRRVQRARTMGSLLKSISSGVVATIAGVMVLAEVGVNIAPILASAGILGLALGFGAQSLVKDYLAGIFMIFEDQYGVGDEVDLGEAFGTVEAVSLRVTRLRDVNGTVWYARNGEILRVGNMSQNWARAVLDVTVAYSEDLAHVRRVLKEVAHDLWTDDDFSRVVIAEPEVWGVQSIGADGVSVRVAVKTAPQEQWRVARELRQRIKARFDYEGIKVPFPEWVVRSHDVSMYAGSHPPLEEDGSGE